MKIIQTNTTDSMQHFPKHGPHATAHHTLHQLTASPCGHSTAMKKLNFTKPLILHEKINNYPRTRYSVTKFNYLHYSCYIKPQTETKTPTVKRLRQGQKCITGMTD
jgi:hypothetical protein